MTGQPGLAERIGRDPCERRSGAVWIAPCATRLHLWLVQRAELEAARRPGFVPSYSPSPIDFDHPLEYRMIDGEHDVFGDGTVVLLPTFGHTPGHQSLLVRAGVGGVSRRATRLT